MTLVTRLPVFGHPAADFDEQLYSLIGTKLLHGLLPYVDLWDRKPPGLFLIYALADAIGGDGPVPYQVLALLACLIGGWQVWRLGRHITDSGTAALASTLYPALMALFDCHSGQSEIFVVPLLMAMALLLLAASDRPLPCSRYLCMAAMAVGGLALQVKYTALVQCLFLGACALWLLRRQGRSWAGLTGDAAAFAVLGLLPTALAAAFYAWHGAFGDFLFAQFQSIGRRGAMPFEDSWQDQILFAIPLLALALGGCLVALRLRPEMATPLWKLALAWLACSVAGLFMVSTIYSYYYGALAPAAVLVALPLFDRRTRWGLFTLALVTVGLIAGFDPLYHRDTATSDRTALDAMTRTMRPFVDGQRHCLYIFDGPTVLYRLTGSGLPTRFIYPDHLNNALEARALPVDPVDEVTRIFAERPGAVVTTRDPVTMQNAATNAVVARELAAHYRSVGQWTLDDRRLDVHVRLPDADGLAPPCHLRR